MKLKRSILNSDSGMTLVELLVATTVGLVLTGLTVGVTLRNRDLLQMDLVRVSLNDNLRAGLDLIGVNIRQSGENLSSVFPAIEVLNGADGAPDELILRRSLLDESIYVCRALPDTSANRVYFAINVPDPESGCIYSSTATTHDSWSELLASTEDELSVYLLHEGTKDLYRYTLAEVVDDTAGAERYIETAAAVTQILPALGASGYLLEEWHFRVIQDASGENLLQLIQNGDTDNPLNVVSGITDLQIAVRMSDGTTQDAFPKTDRWTEIEAVEIQLTGNDTYRNQPIARTLTASYFPRNILSN